MTLDASGNLALGTTSTSNITGWSGSATGQVIQGATPVLAIVDSDNTTNFVTWLANSGGITYLYNKANDALVFGTNNTERMRIDSSGNLLVGTTSTAQSSGDGAKIKPDGSCYLVGSAVDSFSYYNSSAGAYRFYVQHTGQIAATFNTIASISDQRLKENIRDLDNGLNAVMALKPRKYDWKEGKGADKKDCRGFIAQEFEEVFPDLIDEWQDPAPEGEEPYKSVRQDLIPVLVKAIQELKAELDTVKAELATLKGN
jgi:hypothetical protein